MEIDYEILLIVASVFVGGIIGIEREYQLKAAGLRTMILVTLGSCMFTMLSRSLGAPGSPDRIAANIITGIGFVGAGVILKKKTECPDLLLLSLFGFAALGMTIGAGYYIEAGYGMVVVVILLISLKYVQNIYR